jgi:uncharacterized protein (TIGR02145 family)
MCKNYCFLKPVLLSLSLITNIVLSQNSVTDVDGNVYNYSTYGTQIWTIQNAAMETYRDGTPIPQVTDFTTWENSTTGAWCYYNNDPTKGKLYNWYAVAGIHDNDPNTPNKEFAPQGWKVPSDQDLTTLEEYLIASGYNYDGTTTGNKIAKSMSSTSGWNNSTTIGSPGNNQSINNSSAFNAIPVGNRASGSFASEGDATVFWCSTEFDANFSWFRTLSVNSVLLFRNNDEPKQEGLSVRFIQDDCQISASATEVCAGEPVDLTVSSGLTAGTTACTSADLPANLQTGLVGYWPFCGNANDESGNGNNGTVNGATLTTDRFGNLESAYDFDGNTSIINLPEISPDIGTPGTVTTYSMWFKGNAPIQGGGSSGQILSAKSPTTNDFYIRFEVTYVGDHFLKVYYKMPTESNEPFSLFENSSPTWHNIIVEINSVTGDYNYYFDGVNIPEMNFTFNPSNNYYTPSRNWQIGRMDPPPNGFQPHAFQGSIDDIGVWNRALTPTEISSLYNSNFTTYLWSTGDTTETISVSPTETTEYWVDVTTNGVTCREFVTITVTAPAAPTGEAEQTFCSGATVADLVATGTAIQWYDAATGGNLLDPTTALTNGQMIYATQTVDGCESEDRLMVTVSVQEITITASATEVCAGESVDLSVSASVLGSFSNWNTNEPNNAFGPENWGEIFSYSQNQGKWNDFSSNNIYSVIEYNGLITSLPGCVYIGQLAGHSYFYKEINGSWTVASNHAISLGGYLAIINSQAENDLISQNIPIPNGFGAWIGMYQDIQAPNYSEPNGGWKWVDGSDVEMNSNMNSATYLWSTGDTTETISVTPTETTEYWVDVTVNGVTCREFVTITVTETLGVDDVELKDFRLYPNPTKDKLYFNSSQIINRIRIYNAIGQLLGDYLLNDTDGEIDLGKLENGVYFIKINDQLKSYSVIKN